MARPPKQFWLVKSEPDAFSIDDLERVGVEHWDGVRNYQARNSLQAMRVGDEVLFYHSNAKVPGVVGVAKVVREAYPDHTAQDPASKYYDPKASPEKPIWYMPDIGFVSKLTREISLHELQGHADDPAFENFPLVRKGNRLSVLALTKSQRDLILGLERRKPR